MSKARCKFTVQSVTHHAYGGATVNLGVQYDKDIPEDVAFTKATPSGTMSFQCDNPALEGFFKPGKAYYVDLVLVEEEAKA